MEIYNKSIFNNPNIENKQNNYRGTAIKIDIGNVKLKQLGKDTVSFCSNKKQNTVEQINLLKGDPFDNANAIKNILLEEMGLPKDCIQVELLKASENECYCDYFNMSTGNILLHRNPNLTKKDVAITIRHELEHFKQSLGYVKNFGVEEYKKYVEESGNIEDIQLHCPDVSTKFNYKLWNNKKLYSKVDKTKEQCLNYVDSLRIRHQLDLEPDSLYRSLKSRYLYFKDPAEQEAYKAQDELALKFGIDVEKRISTVFMEEFPNIEKKMNDIRTIKPYCRKYMPTIFEKAYQKSMARISVDENYGMSEEDIKKLIDGIMDQLDIFSKL